MANHVKWVNNLSDDSTLTFNFSQLVKASVLTVRDVGSWWIAIPCAGILHEKFHKRTKGNAHYDKEVQIQRNITKGNN